MNKNIYFPDPTADRDEHKTISEFAAGLEPKESISEFMRKASFERIERLTKKANRKAGAASS